jgi:hypothetical protein
VRLGAQRVIRVAMAGVAAAGLAAGGLVVVAGPASAGLPTFDVSKVVVGTAPAGTTFTVAFSCNDDTTGTLTFPANGGPTQNFGPQNGMVNPLVCSVNETANGGAVNVAYTCSNAGNPDTVCSADGKSATFNGGGSPAAAFTITNTFFVQPSVNPNPASAGQSVTVSQTNCTKQVFGGSQSTGGHVFVTIGFSPPLTLGPIQAQGGTGSWSVTFTVPLNTPSGPFSVSAVCNDPAPYPVASLTVIGAIVAPPRFTG